MATFRSLAAAALTLVALTLVALAATTGPARAADGVRHRTLLHFQDPRVLESSGLVDRGRDLATINDSGDGPFVYVVAAATGRTVGVTTYSAGAVEDVEAIAPGRHGSVWVGDTGDNTRSRDDICVYHVPRLRPGDRTVTAPRYRLAYPDGAHDAEALLVTPGRPRVFVVTKSVFGGTVYAAPRRLRTDRVNRLRPFASVPGLVTDGSFLPDGRHVLLRTYGTASAYTFPGFHLVGTVTLPAQPQGEGLSVGRQGRILVSSEGERSSVLEVHLPAGLAQRVSGTRPDAPLPPAVRTTQPPVRDNPASSADHDRGLRFRGGVGVVLAALAMAALGYLTLRGARLRGPRRR
ncbi:MAG: hypothetical protein ACXVXB_11095 [Nocardioidaceae bacterium]